MISLLYHPCCFSQAVTVGSGNWFSGSTWLSGIIPIDGEAVIISVNDSVVIDSTTATIGDITVVGKLTILDSSSASLKTDGGVTINGVLTNNGNFQMLTAGKTWKMSSGSLYVHNPRNNAASDETPFSNGFESFDPNSTLQIKKWSNGFIPLGSTNRVSGDFGNLILSTPITWSQEGFFAPSRIKGMLTVTDGNIVMDDGISVPSTALTLKDVLITGNGSITFQTGFNRPLSLTTGNFTDNSTSTTATTIMNGSYGNLNFTVNGDLNLSHDFSAVAGAYSDWGANPQINVNGNFTISGGSIELVKQADAPLLLNVTGVTTIEGSPSKVRFIDGNSGSLTFNTSYLVISGGYANSLLGGNPAIPKPTGGVTVNITNDFLVNGSSNTIFGNSDTTLNKVRITIGRDFILSGTGANVTGANTNGAFTFKTVRNFSMLSGKFSGQINPGNAANDSIITGGDFTFNSPVTSDYFRANTGAGNTIVTTTGNFNVLNSGTGSGEGVTGIYSNNGTLRFSVGGYFLQNAGLFSGIYNGNGNLIFTVSGIFDMNGGIFKGVNNISVPTAGTTNFTVLSVDYDGGLFSAFHASNNNGATGSFTINGNCKLNFTSASDQFSFAGIAFVSPNNNALQLSLAIQGDLIIGGVNGTFVSSHSQGAENVNIFGNVAITAGNNSFNSIQASGFPNGHSVNLTVSKNILISGGNTFLSAMSGSLTATDSGNVVVSGGTLSVKGGDGSTIFDIMGSYSQTAGNFYLHNATNDGTSNIVTVNINSDDDSTGNFVHSGGSIFFENCTIVPPAANSTNVNHQLNIKSPDYTIGPAGLITSAFPGSGQYFGDLHFSHTGTIRFTRSGTHNIQQVKQSINSGCTVNVVSGNVQIASYNTAALDLISLQPNATLALQSSQVYSNATGPFSGILLYQGSRLKTQHPNGLYNNTASAAISNAGNMNYYLDANSTVEYYGTDNQVITGTGLGNAVLFYHQYGILDINFGGTPDSEFVYPTATPNINAVFVRSKLVLTSGELNLDNDHNGINGGGRILYVSNDSTIGITRTGGYVRSEIADGSGMIRWKLNSKTGPHVFPFGYNSTNYIPFTFDPPSGTSGEVTVATFHTDTANLPLPSGVSQILNQAGTDNSSNMADRFWYLNVSGSAPTANLTFVAAADEMGTIVNPLAQRWLPGVSLWEAPKGSQSNVLNGTHADGIPGFPNWWALSGNATPLPVELITFTGQCYQKEIQLSWITASEIQNDFFTIERSPDGILFEKIGTRKGVGNSSMQNSYSFPDEHPGSGYNYYRLKQTDYDGREKYFETVGVKSCDDKDLVTVNVYTDANNTAGLFIHSPYRGQFILTIFDAEGKKLHQRIVEIEKADNLLKLDLSEFSSGVYLVNVRSDRDVVSKKFVLNKR